MANYCVNTNPQANGDHEVHNLDVSCSFLPDPTNRLNLRNSSDLHHCRRRSSPALCEGLQTSNQSDGDEEIWMKPNSQPPMVEKPHASRTRVRHVSAILLTWVVLVLVTATAAYAAGTVDTKWFGWVTENGGSHRVCGHAKTELIGSSIYAVSGTWYEGWGQTDPPCVYSGDLVATGWLGAKNQLYKNGSLCASSGDYFYNGSSANGFEVYISNCADSAGSQNWQAWAAHRWWAKDANTYASGSHWSPIYSH